MKTFLTRLMVGIMVTFVIAVTFPMLRALGVTESTFAISGPIVGAILIWFFLQYLEGRPDKN